MKKANINKEEVVLTPKEYEALQLLKYEIKDADSIAEAKFYEKQIYKLLARGKRKAMEKRIKKSD